MAKKDYEEKYTHPDLREEIKEEIKASDKGGDEGQWSARKSQMLTQEYEKRGGGYKGEKDQSQENLSRWTEEEWQTKEGDTNARGKGETKRYLPKEAWENMSEEEKEETDKKKQEGSRQGQQHVENTDEAKQARKEAGKLPIDGYEDLSAGDAKKQLGDLSEGDLEKVRKYEEKHGERKTVLEAIDKKL